MLPQNMVPWHIRYLKLKEFFKWQMQKDHSDLPFFPSSLKEVIKLPSKSYPSCTRRKEGILKTRDGEFGAQKSE